MHTSPTGIVFGKDLLTLTPAEVRRTFEVNVLALFNTVRCLLPGMVQGGRGVIVTMSSAMGLRGGWGGVGVRCGAVSVRGQVVGEGRVHRKAQYVLLTAHDAHLVDSCVPEGQGARRTTHCEGPPAPVVCVVWTAPPPSSPTGGACLTDYSASKFAAAGFAESLRYELQRMGCTGVSSLLVHPYATKYVQTLGNSGPCTCRRGPVPSAAAVVVGVCCWLRWACAVISVWETALSYSPSLGLNPALGSTAPTPLPLRSFCSTGMFDGVFETCPTLLHKYVVPVLTDAQVSAAVLDGIERGVEVRVLHAPAS
jgi:NAD(P)-dependent dehydrogenase (short-subunit alcohol dehydrogenase family)